MLLIFIRTTSLRINITECKHAFVLLICCPVSSFKKIEKKFFVSKGKNKYDENVIGISCASAQSEGNSFSELRKPLGFQRRLLQWLCILRQIPADFCLLVDITLEWKTRYFFFLLQSQSFGEFNSFIWMYVYVKLVLHQIHSKLKSSFLKNVLK